VRPVFLITLITLLTVATAQSDSNAVPAIPVIVPEPPVTFPVDTQELLRRAQFKTADYDTLFEAPVSDEQLIEHGTIHIQHRDLILPIVCLMLLGYVTWLRYTFNKELGENFTVIANTNLAQQIFRDREFSANIFKLLTFLNFTFALALLLYLLCNRFRIPLPFVLPALNLTVFFVGLSVLYLSKGIVYRFIGRTFRIQAQLQFFRFNALVIYHLLGIGLLPFVLVGAFADPQVQGWSLAAGVCLVGIALLIRVYKGFTIAVGYGKLRILYFLLYICALEVAPVLIALRLFDMWAGKQPN